MYVKKDKVNMGMLMLISVMLLVFCVSKVLRGANTASTTEGGFWNYISLLYYAVVVYGILKRRVFKIRAVFVWSMIYCVVAMSFAFSHGSVMSNKSQLYNFLMIPYFFLVFVSFYLFSAENRKTEKIILLAYIVCLFINALTTILYLGFGNLRAMANDVYFSLCLMPFALLFIKNKFFKTAIVVLQFFVSFLANKRAGFIALCIGLVVYYLVEANNSPKNKLSRVFGRIILIAASIFLLYRISYYIDSTFDYGLYDRLDRLIDDGGSGRSAMYTAIWNSFWSSNWFQILFGHGMNTAGDVVGAGRAHNDFLEVMYNYGIIAFFCMAGFYLSMIFHAVRMIRHRSHYAPAFAFSIVIGLTLSMFSYFLIFYTFVTGIVSFWGYALKMEKNGCRLNIAQPPVRSN